MARPKKDELDRRTRMVQVRVSPREENAFLSRAVESGREPAAYARAVLCGAATTGRAPHRDDQFELVDILMRLGVEMQRARALHERTGVPSAKLSNLCDQIEIALDKVLET